MTKIIYEHLPTKSYVARAPDPPCIRQCLGVLIQISIFLNRNMQTSILYSSLKLQH